MAYNLARTYFKRAPHTEDPERLWKAAEMLLEPLTQGDGADPSALLLYGECRENFDDHEGSAAAYKKIVDQGYDFVPRTLFRVAEFSYASALSLIPERREEGLALLRQLMARFEDPGRAAPGALERGRYTLFRALADAPSVKPDPREMNWHRVTARTGLPKLGEPAFFIAPDIDRDCARDLVLMGETGVRLLRNRRNATFEDQTKTAGLPLDLPIAAAAAGDLNNDGLLDLVVGGPGGIRIFLNETSPDKPTRWTFFEYKLMADPPAGWNDAVTCLTLWDFDHDGDLDLFAGGPKKNRIYRTAAEADPAGGRHLGFENFTERLGLQSPPAHQAVILDVDSDDDLDLLVMSGAGSVWFENLRELNFKRHDLPGSGFVEVADVDNDLQEEILLGTELFKWRNGSFESQGRHIALLDLDGDGVIDEEPFAGLPRMEFSRHFAADLNRDGNRDLLFASKGSLEVFLSLPAHPYAWIDVQTNGDRTNRAGIGTRVELYVGDLRIGATMRDGLLSFGLGPRTTVQAVSVFWTNGVAQGTVLPLMNGCLAIEERLGEVGSCPFLYAYDGKRWHFITDCHSGTPLGLPAADGVYLPPRSDETVFVSGRLLAPADGLLRLDIAEELREITFLDRVILRAIDHPVDVRPVLNEGFRVTRHPEFRVHGLDDLMPPRSARDHKGRDLLAKVARKDGRHAVVFDPLPMQYEGLAREWSIVLDFGDLSQAERVLLVMDGWVEFPSASASIAASHAKTVAFKPPVLEVIGADGAWTVADPEPGFPAGKGKSVLVDLTGRIPTSDGRIRITSTLRIHWDAFAVSVRPDREQVITELPLQSARHDYRGMGEPIIDATGERPWRYSHDRLVGFHRWGQRPVGMLTRYGDVLELLRAKDSRYSTVAAGDVVELAFDASRLPPLEKGWVRDYCLTTIGWVKDADMNQAVRETVGPLPFHGMSRYPYPNTESHPHPDFVKEWFTRPSRPLDNEKALLGTSR